MTITKVEPHESIPGAWHIEETMTQEQYDDLSDVIKLRLKIIPDPITICSSPMGPNWIYKAWKRAQEENT